MTVDCRWEVIPVFHPELTRPKVMFWISLVVRWGFLLSAFWFCLPLDDRLYALQATIPHHQMPGQTY